MKRIGIPLLLFLILGGASAWYLTKGSSSKKTSYDISDREFATDPSEIYKIFLADRKGETVTLERKEKGWIYNKKYKARPGAMRNLLDAIEKIELKYIPPKAAVPGAVKTMVAHGIKVELYDKNNEQIKVYYVGGMTNDEMGTYMIMEGSDNPYVMHIPTWAGGLRARYFMHDDDWRDKTIFGNEVEEIDYVSVDYPKQKANSFELRKVGNDYEVKPLYNTTDIHEKAPSKGKVEAYLVNYKSVVAEAFQNRYPTRDSISALLPFCKIQFKNSDGESKTAEFHPIYTTKPDGRPLADSEVVTGTPVERYHVNLDNEDFMLVQQRVFGKLFWSYDSFFE